MSPKFSVALLSNIARAHCAREGMLSKQNAYYQESMLGSTSSLNVNGSGSVWRQMKSLV